MLLCAVLLFPLLVVDVPPLLDYPNHLARAYLLAGADGDAALAGMYVSHWAIIPNLAVDLLLPPLIRILPVHVAGRLLLAVALLLPVAGTVLYSRAVFGRWHGWPWASCLVSCNGLFLLGFLNFQLGVGLALMCAAAWIAGREVRPATTMALGAASAVILFFSHMMGLALFLLLVGAYEADRVWVDGRRDGRMLRTLATRAFSAALLLVLPVALYAVSAFGDQPSAVEWETARNKFVRAGMGFVAYDLPADLAACALLAGVLLACLAARRLDGRRHSVLALVGVAGLFVACPFGLKATGYLDARFAVMGAMLAFGAIRPRLPDRLTQLATAVVAVLFVTRTAGVAALWQAHAADLAQLRTALAPVEPGQRVLLALVDQDEATPEGRAMLRRQMLADGSRLDGHTAALVLIERHAFWQALFARPEQQPIALRPPFRRLASLTHSVPNLRLLGLTDPGPADLAVFPLAGRWADCYDYVLLVEAGAGPPLDLPLLDPVVQTPYAALFRTRQDQDRSARIQSTGKAADCR